MDRMRKKTEARFKISDRSFITDYMEVERPGCIHYRGLD